jgi:uncharacterized delta-60 repeat protein
VTSSPGTFASPRVRRYRARRLSTAIAAAVAAGLLVAAIASAAGQPDPTLDGVGWLALDPALGYSTDVQVDASGNMLVAAAPTGGGTSATNVVRLLPTGAADPSFGSGGIVSVPGEYGGRLAIQADGKVLLAARHPQGGMAVYRFLADGTLDPAFGDGGRSAIAGMGKVATVNGIEAQSDGRIVVGMRWGSSPEGIGLVRLTTAGALDPAFGSAGVVEIFAAETWLTIAFDVAPDDDILVGGFQFTGYQAYVMRLGPNGTPDAGFGSGGVALPAAGWNEYQSVLGLADGSVVAAGRQYRQGNNAWIVSRFGANGTPDAGFGAGGSVEVDASAGDDAAVDLAVSGSGTGIYASGYVEDDAKSLTVARLTASGALDPAFGTGGLAFLALPDGRANSVAIAVQPDRSVVATGAAWNTQSGVPQAIVGRYVDDLLLTPAYVEFGSIARDVTDDPVTLTLTNTGSGSASVTSATLTGEDAADFSITGQTCTSGAIAVGASCSVTLGFTPSAIGSRDAVLQLSGPGSTGTRKRVIHGTGLDPVSVLPSSVAFGSIAVGLADTAETVTLSNIGAGPASVTSVTVSGAHAADFSINTDTCTGGPVGSGGSCTVSIGFTPSATGARAASLAITGPSPVDTRVIAVGGDGLDPVTADPSSLAFGSVARWSTSATRVVTVGNIGGLPAQVTGVALTGAHAADFAIGSQTCTAAVLGPSASCTIPVTFTPGADGERSATLELSGPPPVGTRSVALGGTGVQPTSGTAWGSTLKAGPAYTWNYGTSLGRTVSSGSQRLHVAYSTDRIGGSWARDSGPYVGVYYTRSSSGSTWSTPKRLNPTSQHAARTTLAAAGSRVYVAWVSQTRWVRYSATAPRVLYVRVNTSHGASTKWRSTVRLSSSTGRVDHPSIAATGSDAHIAWTDSGTGKVRVTSSRDRGVSWRSTSIGTTALADRSGKTGLPVVAASGSVVAVVWAAGSDGTIQVRVSSDRGVTWGPTETVGSQATSSAGVAVRAGRIVVAWTTQGEVVVRQRIGDTWSGPVTIASIGPEDGLLYGPTVALQDPARVAIAWSHQQEGDLAWSTLAWRESSDGGATWFPAATLASSGSSARRSNDWATVLWPSADNRLVAWNGWTLDSLNYRLYLRRGTGTAPGPATVVSAWEPGKLAAEKTMLETREPAKADR